MKTNDTTKSFTLRLKPSLFEKLEREAQQMGVSKNAFILMVLSKELSTKEEDAV